MFSLSALLYDIYNEVLFYMSFFLLKFAYLRPWTFTFSVALTFHCIPSVAMLFSGQHPSIPDIPSIGMALPGLLSHQLGGNSETNQMTWCVDFNFL